MILTSIIFALGAAAVFGLNMHVQNKGLDDTDGLTGAFLSVFSMAVAFWAFSPFFVDFGWFWSHAVLYFAASGLVVPAAGQVLQILGIRLVGPAIASGINGFFPVFSVTLAVLILGETFGLQSTIGLSIMIAGVLFAAFYKGKVKRNWPLWAITVPLAAAFFRGVQPVLNKQGFAEINSPYFAVLVMSTVSTIVLLVLLAVRRKPAKPASGRSGVKWFALSGLINGLGILFVNLAVSYGDVSIVSPLLMSSPIFSLALSAFVFKREHLGLTHVVLTTAVVVGSVIIVMR